MAKESPRLPKPEEEPVQALLIPERHVKAVMDNLDGLAANLGEQVYIVRGTRAITTGRPKPRHLDYGD
jgi:hypothetical protein